MNTPEETLRFKRACNSLWLQALGGRFNDNDYLELNVAAFEAQRALERRLATAVAAVNAVTANGPCRVEWGKEALVQRVAAMELQLAAARAAVEAI